MSFVICIITSAIVSTIVSSLISAGFSIIIAGRFMKD